MAEASGLKTMIGEGLAASGNEGEEEDDKVLAVVVFVSGL